VGVPLPEALLPAVLDAQRDVAELAGVRLVTREQLHVTLAFLGEVAPEVSQAVADVVRGLGAVNGGQALLAGLLPLPSARRARVVALAITDSDGVFERLYSNIWTELERKGIGRREKRPFRPHLTLARLNPPASVQPRHEWRTVPFEIESVCLYRSELRRQGALYTVIEQARLASSTGPELERDAG
jgi:2'-5' RNA ligase